MQKKDKKLETKGIPYLYISLPHGGCQIPQWQSLLIVRHGLYASVRDEHAL